MQNHKSVNLPSHICGAALGFLGFAISLIIGLYVGNPFVTLVLRATGILVVFYILGLILAAVGHKVVQENFEAEAEQLLADAKITAQAEADTKAQAWAEDRTGDEARTEPAVAVGATAGQPASTAGPPTPGVQQNQPGRAQNQPQEEPVSVGAPP